MTEDATMDRSTFLQFARDPSAARARLYETLSQKKGVAHKSSPVSVSHSPAPFNIAAGLESYAEPLDRRHAAHLLRRTGFGAWPDEINALVGLDSSEAVDAIIDAAMDQALPQPPAWANEGLPRRDDDQDAYFTRNNEEWLPDYLIDHFKYLYGGGLQARLTLFWHNHFVTEIESYAYLAVVAYRYVTTLQTYALGNFKSFVHAMGQEISMLLYLNGVQNQAGAPNENYARELLELFTMGITDLEGNANYTQKEIEEIARALTGWAIDPFNLLVQLIFSNHDFGEKTFFGHSGEFGYDDVIDVIFEERGQQIAEFVCGKLYREFVYEVPDESVVSELADVFVTNNFEIAPVLRVLLKSAHFQDAQVIGAQLKSPVAVGVGMMRELRFVDPSENLYLLLYYVSVFLNQPVLDPPNVAGWPGYRSWIDTSTLPNRWLAAEALLYGGRNQMPVNLVPLAETLLQEKAEDPGDPASVFALASALTEHLITTPGDALDLNVSNEDFAGDLINFPIPDHIANGPAYVRDLAKIFLAGVPWYEWDLYTAEAHGLLLPFARYLMLLPEFQLT